MTTAPATTAHPTFADLLRPRSESARAGLYDLSLVLLGSLFVAACAQIAIPLPGGVPITGQTFAVLLVGAVLGPTLGAAALGLYLIEGLAGLPVFANLHAGVQPLSMGFILAFIPAASLCGFLARRGWDRTFGGTLGAMTLATGVIFAGGLVWMLGAASLFEMLDPKAVMSVGLLPFLPGAAIKIVLAALLLPTAWKIVRH